MITLRTVLEGTDWDSLEHAYGPASDAPVMLTGLLSEDPVRCGEALAYLSAVLLHQGTPYSATPPAALFVAGILDDPRTLTLCQVALPWHTPEQPVRVFLLHWLASVAETAGYGEREPIDDDVELDPDDLKMLEACRSVRADLYPHVAGFLNDPDRSVRLAAIQVIGPLLLAPDLAGARVDAANRLLHSTVDADPDERINVALFVGQWGLSPLPLLTDPDPGVRLCATLAPALDRQPTALAQLKTAMREVAAADAESVGRPLLQFADVRAAVTAALLRRSSGIAEIVEEACDIGRVTHFSTAESDCGPLLARAFPHPHLGCELTDAQRAFLIAIVDNEACWGTSNHATWLRQAGLPTGRYELRHLARDLPPI